MESSAQIKVFELTVRGKISNLQRGKGGRRRKASRTVAVTRFEGAGGQGQAWLETPPRFIGPHFDHLFGFSVSPLPFPRRLSRPAPHGAVSLDKVSIHSRPVGSLMDLLVGGEPGCTLDPSRAQVQIATVSL